MEMKMRKDSCFVIRIIGRNVLDEEKEVAGGRRLA